MLADAPNVEGAFANAPKPVGFPRADAPDDDPNAEVDPVLPNAEPEPPEELDLAVAWLYNCWTFARLWSRTCVAVLIASASYFS